jgi:hypothetical protein
LSLDLDVARVASREMRVKLDSAALETLKSGSDWAEGPPEFECDPHPFEACSLFEPMKHTIVVKAGPVPTGWNPPYGWSVIRHADWVAAGKPGLSDV